MMKTLIIQVLPFGISIILLLIYEIIKKLLGNKFNKVQTYATEIIKALLQEYPEDQIEDIISKAVLAIEEKFGQHYLDENDIKIIIRAVIKDLQLTTGQILDIIDNVSFTGVTDASQKYISGEITADKRKEMAISVVNKALSESKVTITKNLNDIIESKIHSKVYTMKTPDERKNQEQNTFIVQIEQLQKEVGNLQSEINNLQAENTDLKQKLSTIQDTTKSIS